MDRELRNYYQEIKRYEPLSKEEQEQLIVKIKKDGNRDAYLKLYHSNLKLVIVIAKGYFHYETSLSKMDLIQEGNMGLLKAIEKYNLNYINEKKFSSYAYEWIRQYIERAIKNYGFTIRIPVHKFGELKRYEEKYHLLLEKLNRIPTVDELAKELQMSKDTIRELSSMKTKINVESLNDTIWEDQKNEYISIIDSEEQDILTEIATRLDNEQLKNAILSILTEKQAKVIQLRYGLEDGIARGYQEVANILQYKDRRNVETIEKLALKKIKKKLENYNINNSNKKSR